METAGVGPEPAQAPDGLRHAVAPGAVETLCGLSTGDLYVFGMDFDASLGAKPRCPVCAKGAGSR